MLGCGFKVPKLLRSEHCPEWQHNSFSVYIHEPDCTKYWSKSALRGHVTMRSSFKEEIKRSCGKKLAKSSTNKREMPELFDNRPPLTGREPPAHLVTLHWLVGTCCHFHCPLWHWSWTTHLWGQGTLDQNISIPLSHLFPASVSAEMIANTGTARSTTQVALYTPSLGLQP